MSLIPCSDLEKQTDKEKANIEISAYTDTHSGEEHNDLCTPFCTCDCCTSGLALFSFAFQVSLPDLNLQPEQVIYIQPRVSTFNHSIWQPPKV